MTSPDSRKCRFYYVTWDGDAPHGCRALGFKSRRLPHLVVLESSGLPCQAFSPKPDRRARDVPAAPKKIPGK